MVIPKRNFIALQEQVNALVKKVQELETIMYEDMSVAKHRWNWTNGELVRLEEKEPAVPTVKVPHVDAGVVVVDVLITQAVESLLTLNRIALVPEKEQELVVRKS